MLDKNIKKSGLFEDKNICKLSKNGKKNIEFTFNINKVMNRDCPDCIYCKCKNDEIKTIRRQNKKLKDEIIHKDEKINELENYINDFICFTKKYNINNIKDLKSFIINKSEFVYDDLMDIDYDVFEYESTYLLEKQIEDYEGQLDILNNFFNDNNINNLSELKKRVSRLSLNDKYYNVNMLLDDLIVKSKSQNNNFNVLLNDYNNFDNKIKKVKHKLSNLKDGTIITIKGVKKIYKNKIEKKNIFKMIEQEFNDYCDEQIKWAKTIIDGNYNDCQIIKLLDILNKLNKEYLSDDSSSDELDIIVNKMEKNKNNDFELMANLGKVFLNKNITDKSQISDFIERNKKILHYYDVGKDDNKVNRFISTCKRLNLLSNNIKIKNIVKSKCITSIRDMANKDFNNLMLLLNNKNRDIYHIGI